MISAESVLGIKPESGFFAYSGDFEHLESELQAWGERGLLVRVLRGSKMRTVPRLMDEAAAALQFPWYFGENWDALDECLRDLDWLPIETGFVLVVRDARCVLDDEAPEQLGTFIGILEGCALEYSMPVALGEAWDRPAIPFHVVLHDEPEVSLTGTRAWKAAGARLRS